MNQDATLWQGDDKQMSVTVYTSSAMVEFKDLTSATLEYRLGNINNDRLIFRATQTPTANGSFIAVTNPTLGGAVVVLASADTLVLKARKYTQQIVVTDSSGHESTVIDGHLTVKEALPSA